MKRFLYAIVVLCCCLLSGCFSCLSSWCLGEDTYQRLMQPKTIGMYWEKPLMTADSWRADWIDCGGRPNGSYSPDKPDGPSDAAFHAAYKKKAHHLWSCMNAKGYHFTEQWSSDW